jgi:hypothetical protein
VGHTVTDRLDHAGTLDTDAAGKRQRVTSRPMVNVDIVDAYGLLAKPDFSGTGLGQLFLRPFQDIGRADARDLHCMYGVRHFLGLHGVPDFGPRFTVA